MSHVDMYMHGKENPWAYLSGKITKVDDDDAPTTYLCRGPTGEVAVSK